MSNFTATALANENYLVEGTDIRGKYGEIVVSGSEWISIKRELATHDAKKQLDAAVEEFFKPLVEAADAFTSAKAPVMNELAVIVLSESIDGQVDDYIVDANIARIGANHSSGSEFTDLHKAVRQRKVHYLGRDAQILRVIEEGKTERLLWVGGGLVITAAPAAPEETTVEPDVAENEPPF